MSALLDDEALTGHPGVHVIHGATHDAYQQWAPSYNDPGNELLELDLPVIDDILADVPAGEAVDAACGTGRLAAKLAARGHKVTGVDDSEAMVEQARGDVRGVRFVVGSLQSLPLAANSADVVTTGLALTHIPDLLPVFVEFARVLRPRGTAIVSDVHPELLYRGSVVTSRTTTGMPQVAASHRHTVAEYVRAALQAGFRIRGLEEPRHVGEDASAPSAEDPATDLGPWRHWPWSLLGRTPEAARAAWDIPSLLLIHLDLP